MTELRSDEIEEFLTRLNKYEQGLTAQEIETINSFERRLHVFDPHRRLLVRLINLSKDFRENKGRSGNQKDEYDKIITQILEDILPQFRSILSSEYKYLKTRGIQQQKKIKELNRKSVRLARSDYEHLRSVLNSGAIADKINIQTVVKERIKDINELIRIEERKLTLDSHWAILKDRLAALIEEIRVTLGQEIGHLNNLRKIRVNYSAGNDESLLDSELGLRTVLRNLREHRTRERIEIIIPLNMYFPTRRMATRHIQELLDRKPNTWWQQFSSLYLSKKKPSNLIPIEEITALLRSCRSRSEQLEFIGVLLTIQSRLSKGALAHLLSLNKKYVRALATESQDVGKNKQLLLMEKEIARVKKEGLIDDTTGLRMRNAFNTDIYTAVDRMLREKHEYLSFILLDLDKFKVINTAYDYGGGDSVLNLIGKFIENHTRESDPAYRFGGEEFAVILSNCDHEKAKEKAEEFRTEIAEKSKDLMVQLNIKRIARIPEAQRLSLYMKKPKHQLEAEIRSGKDDVLKSVNRILKKLNTGTDEIYIRKSVTTTVAVVTFQNNSTKTPDTHMITAIKKEIVDTAARILNEQKQSGRRNSIVTKLLKWE